MEGGPPLPSICLCASVITDILSCVVQTHLTPTPLRLLLCVVTSCLSVMGGLSRRWPTALLCVEGGWGRAASVGCTVLSWGTVCVCPCPGPASLACSGNPKAVDLA